MRRWLQSDACVASELAAALSRDNMQYSVFTEEALMLHARDRNILIEDDNVLDAEEARALALHGASVWKASQGKEWLESLRRRVIPRAVTVEGQACSLQSSVFPLLQNVSWHRAQLWVQTHFSWFSSVQLGHIYNVQASAAWTVLRGGRRTNRPGPAEQDPDEGDAWFAQISVRYT